MSRIRGRDTRPELRLRASLASRGVECLAYVKTPAGRPDLVLHAAQVAVYVDGCFWHGCPEHYVRPRSRTAYWSDRLRTNVSRDRRQTLMLEAAGWCVFRLWEHEVFEDVDAAADSVLNARHGAAPRQSWRVALVEVLDSATDLERQHLVDLRDEGVIQFRDRVRTTRKWTERR